MIAKRMMGYWSEYVDFRKLLTCAFHEIDIAGLIIEKELFVGSINLCGNKITGIVKDRFGLSKITGKCRREDGIISAMDFFKIYSEEAKIKGGAEMPIRYNFQNKSGQGFMGKYYYDERAYEPELREKALQMSIEKMIETRKKEEHKGWAVCIVE